MNPLKSAIRPLLFSLASCLAILPVADAHAQNILILGGTTFYESSTLTGQEQVSVLERDQSFDFRNANWLSARVLYLRPHTERLFIGAGADFIGSYAANILNNDGVPSDPPNIYRFGPMLEPLAIAEWRRPLSEDLSFSLGTQLGLALIFPRGDLAAEIRSLQNNNVRVWRIPRFGGSAAVHTAFVWKLDERLSMRGDLGIQWQNVLIFRTQQTVDDVPFRKHWTTGALRARLGVSLEILL
jgi:hypothetical protein